MEAKTHQSPWKQKREAVLWLSESLAMNAPNRLRHTPGSEAPAPVGKPLQNFPSLVTGTSRQRLTRPRGDRRCRGLATRGWLSMLSDFAEGVPAPWGKQRRHGALRLLIHSSQHPGCCDPTVQTGHVTQPVTFGTELGLDPSGPGHTLNPVAHGLHRVCGQRWALVVRKVGC